MELRQGNIFTGVCPEFCKQGGMHGRVCAWEGAYIGVVCVVGEGGVMCGGGLQGRGEW